MSPLQINTNVRPYHDDFDEKNNYYRVMFKPGFPVQARELTQLQTTLQDQIEKLASRILASGDQVVPGEFQYNNQASYVRLSRITSGVKADEYVGYILTGAVSGVKAKVTIGIDETETDDTTLYIKYLDSGANSRFRTFIEGEELTSDSPQGLTGTVGIIGVSKPVDIPVMGQGTIFTVEEGSYFIDGCIVRNDYEQIIVAKFDSRPSCRIGFDVTEEFVNSSEDTSLLDNAQGHSNFAAPGADRLRITLKLATHDLDAVVPNFVELVTLVQGNLQGKPDQTVKWDWLYDILAKRTFDESGDYIINDFALNTLEYPNDNKIDDQGNVVEVRGLFDADPDNTYPPVPGSGSTERLTFEQADAKYVLEISAGLAYVQGYEVGYKNSIYLYGNKPRTPLFRENTFAPIRTGSFFTISNVTGTPDIQNISGDGNALAFEGITMYRNFLDGYVGQSSELLNGVETPLNRGRAPWKTYHVLCDGDIGATAFAEVYKEGNTGVFVTPSELKRGDQIGGASILTSVEIEPVPSGTMKPRYFTPNQVVGDNTAYNAYTSTHNLGVMTSVFFTEIGVVPLLNEAEDWTVGDEVQGEESGAVGIVEQGSLPDLVVVSNIFGEFRNGEEIFQESSGKTATITRPGEVIAFKFYDKGTSFSTISLENETGLKVTSLGSELELTVAAGDIVVTSSDITLTQQGRDKLLVFPYKVDNTAPNSVKVNLAVETVPSGVKGFSVILPAKLTHTLAKTKSFYSPLNDINKFSADISVQNTADADIYAVADGSLFSGVSGDPFIVCDNFSGDASEDLVAGDVISFADDDGNTVTKLVYFVTKPAGNGSFRERCFVYLTTALTSNITGRVVERVRVAQRGSQNETLVIQLPERVIKSLETNPLKTNINYQVAREFYVNLTGGATTVTLVTNRNNETFLDDRRSTIAVARNLSDPNDGAALVGKHLAIESIDFDDGGRKIIFNLQQPTEANITVKVITSAFVSDAQARRKILRENVELVVSEEDAQKTIISLERCMGYRLKSVKTVALQKDITDNYVFDDGQRDNIYDIARLVKRANAPFPTDSIIVTYDFFDHSDEGDFFSVDSYTHDEGIAYGDIPNYKSEGNGGNGNQIVINLRDCADFRPVVNILPPFQSEIAYIADGVDEQSAKNFRDSSKNGDAFSPRLPTPNTQFQSDLEFYVGKIDSVFVLTNGSITIKEGELSSNPVPPADISNGIRLYDMRMPPYTFEVSEIYTRRFEYKRYRMKDINKIDNRVTKLEEMFTLSLLEQNALNMDVKDAITGLDRFKNAFIVDAFRDHSRGNTMDPYYRNSIDPKFTHLRAPHFTDQVGMEEVSFTDNQRTVNGNYVSKNQVCTLPYSDTLYAQNDAATRWINCQPYAVFTWQGELFLNPPLDTFNDVRRKPDLVIEDNSLYNAMENLIDGLYEVGVLGSVWGDWETTGSEVENRTTGSRWTGQRQGNMVQMTETVEDVLVTTQERVEHILDMSVEGSVVNTSYGDRVTNVELALTMRTRAIFFNATKLKPNTEFFVFFDDIDVTAWCSPDIVENTYADGLARYNGVVNSNPQGFGFPLISDDVGNLQGVWLVPNGRPPVKGYIYQGVLEDVEYQTDGATRSFPTGSRKLRFTSNEENRDSNSVYSDIVDSFAETFFTSSGVFVDKEKTVVGTREITEFTASRREGETEQRVDEVVIGTRTRTFWRTDPVAQSFMVDENAPYGIYITGIDLYFREKDPLLPVEVFFVDTEGGVPVTGIVGHSDGKILPGSKVVVPSDTTLRMVVDLLDDSETLPAGTILVGQTSGATGTVKSDTVIFNVTDNPDNNNTNTVYNVILDNYLNPFVPGEVVVPQLQPPSESTFTLVEDEVQVERIDPLQFGQDYTAEDTQIVFSQPELRGGVAATGTALVTDGFVYDVVLTSPGSGYTKPPTISITGSGTAAEATVRTREGRKAVIMGVALSEDGSAPTHFEFEYPVYLMGANTNYAFCVLADATDQYLIYTSRLGENKIGTEERVVEATLTGSLFKSQNGALWTEEQYEDIKYKLYRADFLTNVNSTVRLQNTNVKKQQFGRNPLETNQSPVIGGSLSEVAVVFSGTEEGTTLSDGSYADVPLIGGSGYQATVNISVLQGQIIDAVINDPGVGYEDLEQLSVDESNAILQVRVHTPPSEIFGFNPRIVKVYCDYHGLVKDDYVQLTGIIGDPGGIPNEEFNALHTVVDADITSFTIKVATEATVTEKAGGLFVFGSFNRPYEVLNMPSGIVNHANTSINVTTRTTQAAGVTLFNVANQYTLDNPIEIGPFLSKYYNGPKLVANYLNEIKYNDTFHLRGEKSLQINFTIRSSNPLLSPVVDVARTNATVVRNLIDNPKPESNYYGETTRTVTYSGIIPDGTVTKGARLNHLWNGILYNSVVRKVNPKTRKVVLSGRALSTLTNNSTFNVAELDNLGITSITDTIPDNFYPETQNNGSVYAKWMSRVFFFDSACDGINLKLTTVQYAVDDIRCFYRLKIVGSDADLQEASWVPFNPLQAMPGETRLDPNTGEILSTPGLPDRVDEIKVRSSEVVDPREITNKDYYSYQWTAQNLTKFDAIQVKVVMTQENPAKAPLIDDMQLVCSE